LHKYKEKSTLCTTADIPTLSNTMYQSSTKTCGLNLDMKHTYRTPDSLWIVMEHCGGGSVADIVKTLNANLDEKLIQYICAETLKVIHISTVLGSSCIYFRGWNFCTREESSTETLNAETFCLPKVVHHPKIVIPKFLDETLKVAISSWQTLESPPS